MALASLLLLALTLGAVALYLGLAGARRGGGGPLALLLFAGTAGALVATILTRLGAHADLILPIAFTITALWGGVRVVTHPRPVYCAIYFILVVVSSTGLLVMLDATFLSVALVIIYAGAILVTYVFVIMLAQQPGEPPRYDRTAREPAFGCVAGFLLLAVISARLVLPSPAATPAAQAATEALTGDVVLVGTSLLTRYVVGIELAAALLLAAMVGGIAIARRQALEQALEEGD